MHFYGRGLAQSGQRLLAVGLAFLLGGFAAAAEPAAGRPASYNDFRVVKLGDSLEEALASSRRLLLLPGSHFVDNPLVIAGDEPVVLHGTDRIQTRLVPRHRDRPLLVIERTPLLNLTNLRLQAPAESMPDFRALVTRNESPADVEIQDCTVGDASLIFGGPGSVRLQGTSLQPHGQVAAPIVVDHPAARFLMVGGNISNEGQAARVATDQSFHVWLKRGRLRVVGTGVQATNGIADFRIDAASPDGPHVIADVRSEGNNGARRGAFPSTLLHVPPTAEKVDVVLLSNSASWGSQGHGTGRFVDYGGAGTLWLVGNNGAVGAGALVTGSAAGATVVAIGNLLFDDAHLVPAGLDRMFATGNLYSHRFKTGNPLPPHIRFARSPAPPEGVKPPGIPAVEIPPPLAVPTLDSTFPGMLDVRAFGALGDGETDDTGKIQAALDAQCDGKQAKRVFFPPGTYRVSRPLRLNHRKAGCQKHPAGGWIAGAGRDRSILLRVGSGGVFATEGLAFATVQGLTFRTAPGGGEPAFALENAPAVGHASQEVSFYDVRFDGGRYALGIGLVSETQCSENLLVDAEFRNADYGLAVGSYNALANLVYRGRFVNNGIAMGQPDDTLSGGTWAVLGATVRDTRRRDLAVLNSASGVWFFYALDSTSPVLVTTSATGAAFPLVFDQARLAPPATSKGPLVDFSAAAGPIFLHSEIQRGALRIQGGLAANYLIDVGSQMPARKDLHAGGQGRLFVVGDAP